MDSSDSEGSEGNTRPGPFYPKSHIPEYKQRTRRDKKIIKHYRISRLIFEILEEVNQHKKSWDVCKQLINKYEKKNNISFLTF